MQRPIPGTLHGQSFFVWLMDPATGDVWNTNTSAFEAYVSANYAQYQIAGTEMGASGAFVYTVPSQLPTSKAYYEIPWMVNGGEGSDVQGDRNLFSWDGTTDSPVANTIQVAGQTATPENVDSSSAAVATSVAQALAGQPIYPQSALKNSSIRVVIKDAYLSANGTAFKWFASNYPNVWPADLAGKTSTLTIKPAPNNPNAGSLPTITATGTILVASGDGQSVQVELPSSLTSQLSAGAGNLGWVFDVVAVGSTDPTDRTTLVSGDCTVVQNVSA